MLLHWSHMYYFNDGTYPGIAEYGPSSGHEACARRLRYAVMPVQKLAHTLSQEDMVPCKNHDRLPRRMCYCNDSCPPFLRTCFTACAHVPSCNVKADAHATCSTLMRGDAPWGRFPQRATSAQRQGPVHRWTILLIQQKPISCQEKSVTMDCYERCAAVASAGSYSSLPRLGSCSFRDSLCFFHNLLPST